MNIMTNGADDEPLSADQWREEIDRRLDAVRPARYDANDLSWAKPVVEWAAANMPPDLIEQVLADPREDRRELDDAP